MAERLNNLLFHTARAREMALEGSTGVPREERTIHGRAWKFSRGSYPVIGGECSILWGSVRLMTKNSTWGDFLQVLNFGVPSSAINQTSLT